MLSVLAGPICNKARVAFVASQRDEGPLWVLCHEHRRSTRRCATVLEMKEGPSGSAIRSSIPIRLGFPAVHRLQELHDVEDVEEVEAPEIAVWPAAHSHAA